MPFVDLEIIILVKSHREKQVSLDITYMQNLKKKNDTNEFIYKTDSQT